MNCPKQELSGHRVGVFYWELFSRSDEEFFAMLYNDEQLAAFQLRTGKQRITIFAAGRLKYLSVQEKFCLSTLKRD